jgi:hypothetical protein
VEFGYINKGGWIYTSSDSGNTWSQRGIKKRWTAIASSADGQKLLAAAHLSPLYLSSDSGVTWTPFLTNKVWTSVASSADGMRLVAVDNGVDSTGGQIYVSTDGGQTWTPREENRHWYDVAMGADGMKIAASAGFVDAEGESVFGYIYTSVDGGTNWTARLTDKPRRWISLDLSADGQRLIAAEIYGPLYLSIDGGLNWRTDLEEAGVGRMWMSVSSTGKGDTLVALCPPRVEARVSGALYVSHDGGNTWVDREGGRSWGKSAVSADGHILFAAVVHWELERGSYIYASTRTTTPGGIGSFEGAPGSDMELQYIGHDQFRVRNASGTLTIEGVKVEAGKKNARPRR